MPAEKYTKIEKFNFENPGPEILTKVLFDPIFSEAPIIAGAVEFSFGGLYRPKNSSLFEIGQYANDCARLGVNPYHSAVFQYDTSGESTNTERLSVEVYPDAELSKTPNDDPTLTRTIDNTIWSNVSFGGRPHLLKYEFPELNLNTQKGFRPSGVPARWFRYAIRSNEWFGRMMNGYQIDRFNLHLESHSPDLPDVWLNGSSESLALNVRDKVCYTYGEGLRLRKRTDQELAKVEKITTWFTSLES